MRWTTEKPSATGWYWYHVRGTIPQIAKLVWLGSALYVVHHGLLERFPADRWAGPIPEPNEEVKSDLPYQAGPQDVAAPRH